MPGPSPKDHKREVWLSISTLTQMSVSCRTNSSPLQLAEVITPHMQMSHKIVCCYITAIKIKCDVNSLCVWSIQAFITGVCALPARWDNMMRLTSKLIFGILIRSHSTTAVIMTHSKINKNCLSYWKEEEEEEEEKEEEEEAFPVLIIYINPDNSTCLCWTVQALSM